MRDPYRLILSIVIGLCGMGITLFTHSIEVEKDIATRMGYLALSYLKVDRGSSLAADLLLGAQKIDPDNQLIRQISRALAENRLDMVWGQPQDLYELIRILIERGDVILKTEVPKQKKMAILCLFYWRMAERLGGKKEEIDLRLQKLKDEYNLSAGLSNVLRSQWTIHSLLDINVKTTESPLPSSGNNTPADLPSTSSSESKFRLSDLDINVKTKENSQKNPINLGYKTTEQVQLIVQITNRNSTTPSPTLTVRRYLFSQEVITSGKTEKYSIMAQAEEKNLTIGPKEKKDLPPLEGKAEKDYIVREFRIGRDTIRQTEISGEEYDGWMVIVADEQGTPLIVKRKNTKLERVAKSLKLLPPEVDIDYNGICKYPKK